jgi:hypothetical protein
VPAATVFTGVPDMLKAVLLVAVLVPAEELAGGVVVTFPSESQPLRLNVTQVTKSTAMKNFVVDAMATIP